MNSAHDLKQQAISTHSAAYSSYVRKAILLGIISAVTPVLAVSYISGGQVPPGWVMGLGILLWGFVTAGACSLHDKAIVQRELVYDLVTGAPASPVSHLSIARSGK